MEIGETTQKILSKNITILHGCLSKKIGSPIQKEIRTEPFRMFRKLIGMFSRERNNLINKII